MARSVAPIATVDQMNDVLYDLDLHSVLAEDCADEWTQSDCDSKHAQMVYRHIDGHTYLLTAEVEYDHDQLGREYWTIEDLTAVEVL